MNPEFERNVWLELTPLRLVVMSAILALAFFAAALSDSFVSPGFVARVLFAIIVVIWGTRNAARSVLGEIRDHTWDGQRLSSLGAATMMWGKLFGSTIFNWFGGAICLAVIVADTVDHTGPLAALYEFGFCIAIGIIAQSASLLASLIAARRRQGRTGFEVFLYQAVGIAAAIATDAIAAPGGTGLGVFSHGDLLVWWGRSVPTPLFLFASLAVFTSWMLTGCYRQMRLELKLKNGPFVWIGFLVFMIAYAAGFGTALGGPSDEIARRLLMAGLTAAALAYVTVILEPKSRVQMRWLAGEFGEFHIGTALSHLECWMTSYLVAILIAIALMVRLAMLDAGPQLAMTGAVLGFFTRDLGLVVLMNMLARRRGGDFLAIALLILAYALLPSILSGLHYYAGQALFLPRQTDPLWFSPAAAWIEAVAIWAIAATQIALAEKKP